MSSENTQRIYKKLHDAVSEELNADVVNATVNLLANGIGQIAAANKWPQDRALKMAREAGDNLVMIIKANWDQYDPLPNQ